MPTSWEFALQSYSYPVDLKDFRLSDCYHPYFTVAISGNRESTIEFENRFRSHASSSMEIYYEVLYWKLYSQPRIRNSTTERIINHMVSAEITPVLLWDKISTFVQNPNKHNLKQIRSALGFTTPVMAMCLTFPAFHSPDLFPMVDNQTARWVNANYKKHNLGNAKIWLSPFSMNYTSLQDDDFPNYIKWIHWCRNVAGLLTKKTKMCWRARDVEMAVFTSQRSSLTLNVL